MAVPKKPDYSHKVGLTVVLAPPEPLLHKCPECSNGKKIRRLTFLHSMSEQWGVVVTRFDFYRCRECRQKFVSTNGRTPEVTTTRPI